MHKKKVILAIVLLLLIVFSRFIFEAVKLTPVLWQLLFSRDISLQKTDDRINVLLLGNAGGTHEGKDLTDTIIVLTIDPVRNEALLISVPRDLWVSELSSKINTAYVLAETKRKGGGMLLAKEVINRVTGLTISYAVKIDFAGFVKAVDSVGGLDIAVDNTLDDYKYPIEGKENDLCGVREEEVERLVTTSGDLSDTFPCRFEHIHFDIGQQNFDGATALKFVRSRNAMGTEGTDFARSKRQQQVLSAFANKLFSLGVLANPWKVQTLLGILRENVESDIKTSELDDFIRLAQKMGQVKTKQVVIDYGDEEKGRKGLLVNPQISEVYDRQWVLIPRIGNGDFSEIHEYIKCQLTSEECQIK